MQNLAKQGVQEMNEERKAWSLKQTNWVNEVIDCVTNSMETGEEISIDTPAYPERKYVDYAKSQLEELWFDSVL